MSSESKVGCLRYIYPNIQGMPQVTWAVDSSVRMDVVQDAGDVVDSNCIPKCYHEYLSICSQKLSYALPLQ
jgi:hypothetical protein